jgi:hypothetical protein
MSNLLSGTVIDAILALIVVEGIALVTWRRLTQSGPDVAGLIANLAAGAFLFLALRTVLAGAAQAMTGLCLIAALVADLADLGLRWRKRSNAPHDTTTSPLQSPAAGARVARDPRDEVSHG